MIREEDVLTVAQIRSAVAPVLAGEPVRFAYLFGSHARGRTHPESDIDIAVLADPTLSKDERFELWMDLYDLIERALHAYDRKVDISMLQDVPVLLRYNVIRKGTCIFETDHMARVFFELRTEQEYEDASYEIDRERRMGIERILHSTPV